MAAPAPGLLTKTWLQFKAKQWAEDAERQVAFAAGNADRVTEHGQRKSGRFPRCGFLVITGCELPNL